MIIERKEITCPYCGAVSPHKNDDVAMAIDLPDTVIKVNCWVCGKLFRVKWDIHYVVKFISEGE